MHHTKAEINRAISQRQHFFMSTNKMAEIVDTETAPVDTFVPGARLDDKDRRKLIAFYKEKPILWDTSLKWSKKAAKEQKETALKDLEEHFHFNYFSKHPLLQNCPSKEESVGILLSSADLTCRPPYCWRKCWRCHWSRAQCCVKNRPV